jgi:ABC-type lipoprotein export system ATPase subunit
MTDGVKLMKQEKITMKEDSVKILEILEPVSFSYPNDEKQYIYCISEGINLLTEQMYSIIGINGSGKSTILTLLAGLRRFNKGKIRYIFSEKKSEEITHYNWKNLAGPQFWGKIGFSFQKPELIRALTVEKNLELMLGDNKTNDMALSLFEDKEWEDVKHSMIWEISGGQVQRLGLIRAFGLNQNLIFVDEPTNNLDKSNREKVIRFIQKYRKNKTVVFVSHDEAFLRELNINTMLEIYEDNSQKQKKRILRFKNYNTDINFNKIYEGLYSCSGDWN